MRRRREHATDRRTVTGMRVRVEHKIRHAGCATGIERLLETRRIETSANGIRADDGDGPALVVRRRE